MSRPASPGKMFRRLPLHAFFCGGNRISFCFRPEIIAFSGKVCYNVKDYPQIQKGCIHVLPHCNTPAAGALGNVFRL